MAATQNFWDRVREDVRDLSERTRQGTRRAIEEGVLRVDLVSLRRSRRRALADLGERTLKFWISGRMSEFSEDAEAIRLRTRIAEVDDRIREKEDALARLRAPTGAAKAGSAGQAHGEQVVEEPIEARRAAADTEETNGIT